MDAQALDTLDKGTPAENREPDKVKPECKECVYYNPPKLKTNVCCSPIACKHQQREVKPLAQYLSEYIEQEWMDNVDCRSWRELLEQALDAYQSTENVTIKIERV